jgi:DNA-binding response OmpR family regulator
MEKIVEHDYDLIIIDMHLPGMDGLHLYHWLQVLRPALATRVIFIADEMADDEVRASLERLGCPLVRKPFSVADIDASLRRVLGLYGS